MMKQSEEFKTYSKNVDCQRHFERKVEAQGNNIKTTFTSRIIFNSSGFDATPSTLVRCQGSGTWFKVPIHLFGTSYRKKRRGDTDSLFKNGGVRLTRSRQYSRRGFIFLSGCNSITLVHWRG